jgi:hypothetical protein
LNGDPISGLQFIIVEPNLNNIPLKSCAARLLAACALLGSIPSAPAAPAANDEQEASMAAQLDGVLTRTFQLSNDVKLDPELRVEADNIGAAHLARIRQLLPTWIREEKKAQASEGGKSNATTVYYAVWARLLNELALWQIEPGNAAYESAMAEALKNVPDVCNAEGDEYFHEFKTRMLRVQAVPPAQRPAVLAAERELLAHWGKPRAFVPPWPNPLPQEAAMAAVARIRSGGPRPAQALTPVLASSLLAKRQDYLAMPRETRCLFQQWWLRTSLVQGVAPETALAAFRYGTLLSADKRFGDASESQQGDASGKAQQGRPAYPKLAARFDVTGVTRVSRRFDASGKPEQASVVERNIKVRGIRGVRPVAFEDVFDATVLRFALDGQAVIPGMKKDAPVFDWVWTLEESTPAQVPAKATQGGSR